MVSDTKPRNGTFTTFLVRVWKGLGNFKAQNEAINRLIVQNEALRKKLDLAAIDDAHWREIFGNWLEVTERLSRILEQETPGANATVKRIMKIARGEL